MNSRSSENRTDPYPPPGLPLKAFRKVSANGFGDPYNAYAHSMAWYQGALYVGTTRANLCMLKVSKLQPNIRIWPVECPDDLYELDMRAQIWRYDPDQKTWNKVFTSPMIRGNDGSNVPRDMGYRGMAVFKGESSKSPALYVAGFASKKSDGAVILRTEDGKRFDPVSDPGIIGQPVTSIRTLTPFKGRLFASPTGSAEGNINTAGRPIIYESRDPLFKDWRPVNEPAFGDPSNVVIFEMAACGDFLYAGTGNPKGFQLWRTRGEGKPPYQWERVIHDGAYRGSLNQCPACMLEFKGDLFLGTAIQHGGIDNTTQTGPAAPELIRVRVDGKWDLIVGQSRDTPEGFKEPLSGFFPGFNNFFNGYFWTMEAHNGWLYVGTFDWSLMLQFAHDDRWPEKLRNLVHRMGVDKIVEQQGGGDLYRSYDGENWLRVTTEGFGNKYNYGIRSMSSTPLGLFVGTVNPFAPRIAVRRNNQWVYKENPKGGLEVWLGEQ